MPLVHLEPISEAAYLAWRERVVADYAADQITSGRWTADDALARSLQQIDELLPSGRATPGHELWTIRDTAGADVGVLWLATQTGRPGHAFIYDIEIEKERRGQGLGRATLEALDEWARANGISSIGLHVFGHNAVARHLYRSVGYVETNVQMEKRL